MPYKNPEDKAAQMREYRKRQKAELKKLRKLNLLNKLMIDELATLLEKAKGYERKINAGADIDKVALKELILKIHYLEELNERWKIMIIIDSKLKETEKQIVREEEKYVGT